MQHLGDLSKMKTVINHPIDYYLPVGNSEIYLNLFIGKQISMEFTGEIHCVHCGATTKKSYSQGYCYNCMQTAPEADESVVRPELSLAQFGISRNMDWALEHDLIDHYVYLAVTNDLKVGVTRYHQIPTRWIDQGAMKAIILAKTPNRHIAGIIETYLKNFVADKTAWQAMLKNEVNTVIDLVAEKKRVGMLLPLELQQYITIENEVANLEYPGELQLQKIESIGFDTTQKVEGKLARIKGQYLIFDSGKVLNIRKHAGYSIVFCVKG